jgi:molybdopterin converting factor small subunit
MKVYIPDALRSYTGDRRHVDARGATLAALLLDLERQFPGIRFRMIDEQDAIRRHMRVFVNGDEARRLDIALHDGDDISIVQALSGG